MTDMGGSWWSLPRAVETAGKLRVGGVDQSGNVVVYDDGIKRTITTGSVDDHRTPCILTYADKPPIVAWSNHNASTSVGLQKGTANDDFSTLGATTTTAFASNTSYVQLYRSPGTDTIYLFTRLNNGGANDRWAFKKSTDYGTTWGAAVTLLDCGGDFSYFGTAQIGSTLRVAVMDGNPSDATDPHTIHYCSINLATGAITKIDGTVIGNLDGTSLPLTPAALDLVYTPGVNDEARLHDVSVATNPEIAISVFTSEGVGSYHIVRWDGAAWSDATLVATGDSISATAGDHYYGGMSFPNPTDGDEAILARESSDVWTVERWERISGTWMMTEVIATSRTVGLIRPYCPVGRSTEPEIIWHRVSRYGAYTSWIASLAAPASSSP